MDLIMQPGCIFAYRFCLCLNRPVYQDGMNLIKIGSGGISYYSHICVLFVLYAGSMYGGLFA